MGMFLVKKAFNLANFADCRGDAEMTVEQALDQGQKLMEEAIKVFEEVSCLSQFLFNGIFIITSVQIKLL